MTIYLNHSVFHSQQTACASLIASHSVSVPSWSGNNLQTQMRRKLGFPEITYVVINMCDNSEKSNSYTERVFFGVIYRLVK